MKGTSLAILLMFMFFSVFSQKEATPEEEQNQMEFNYFFIEASKQKMLGKYNEALELYNQCHHLQPKNSATMYEIARILYNFKDVSGAILYMNNAFKYTPDNVWYGLFLADLHKKNNDLKNTVKVYKKMIKVHPDNLIFHYDLANIYLVGGQYSSAEKVYKSIEKKYGFNEILAQELIKFYFQVGSLKAKEVTERAIKEFHNKNPYYNILAEINLKQGNYDEALKLYNDLIAKDFNASQNKIDVSMIHYYKNDTVAYEKAVRAVIKDESIHPTNKLEYFLSLFVTPSYKSYFKQYEGEYLFIMQSLHSKDVMINLALSDYLIANDRNDEALEYLYFVLSKDKSNFGVFDQIIKIESSALNWEKVFEVSSSALELYPNQPSLFFFNGYSAMHLEKYTEAIDMFKKGVVLSINDELTIDYYTYIADCYYKLANKTEAYNYFEKALKLNGKNAVVLNNYSYYLSLDEHNLETALIMTQLSNSLEPNNATYLDTYAWVLYKLGRYKEAKEKIEEAMKYSDTLSGEILEHYGDILFQLSDVSKAVEQWKKAKSAGDASEEIEDKIEKKQLND